MRANKPLQVIHLDLMGSISPVSYPKGYKFVIVSMDDYSRLAMAYCVRAKSDIGECLESVRSARNMLGFDAKVFYLKTDQGSEFTRGYTAEVLKNLERNYSWRVLIRLSITVWLNGLMILCKRR